MLDTRERKESKVRYERTNEYEPSYRNDYYAENSYTNVETYPEQRRATEEDRYVQRYENVDYGYNECDCMSNENTFRPIELSDIDMNEKSATKKRSKQKFNWSVKSKILVGVYFSLVALIVVMLVNALPSASAQGGQQNQLHKNLSMKKVLIKQQSKLNNKAELNKTQDIHMTHKQTGLIKCAITLVICLINGVKFYSV